MAGPLQAVDRLENATRAPVAGPTFIRLLARVVDADAVPSGVAPSQRLGQWIDWTRAIALSRALDRPLDVPPPAPGGDPQADAARVRSALEARIVDGDAWGRAMPGDGDHATAGFADARKHYTSLQHAIQAATGQLRGNLRDHLAGRGAAQARLAALDAVMEQVASPREQQLLAAVPGLLADRFASLQRQDEAGCDAEDLLAQATPAGDAAWRHALRQDLQDLLRAELDVRFLPIDGLLAALRNQ